MRACTQARLYWPVFSSLRPGSLVPQAIAVAAINDFKAGNTSPGAISATMVRRAAPATVMSQARPRSAPVDRLIESSDLGFECVHPDVESDVVWCASSHARARDPYKERLGLGDVEKAAAGVACAGVLVRGGKCAELPAACLTRKVRDGPRAISRWREGEAGGRALAGRGHCLSSPSDGHQLCSCVGQDRGDTGRAGSSAAAHHHDSQVDICGRANFPDRAPHLVLRIWPAEIDWIDDDVQLIGAQSGHAMARRQDHPWSDQHTCTAKTAKEIPRGRGVTDECDNCRRSLCLFGSCLPVSVSEGGGIGRTAC